MDATSVQPHPSWLVVCSMKVRKKINLDPKKVVYSQLDTDWILFEISSLKTIFNLNCHNVQSSVLCICNWMFHTLTVRFTPSGPASQPGFHSYSSSSSSPSLFVTKYDNSQLTMLCVCFSSTVDTFAHHLVGWNWPCVCRLETSLWSDSAASPACVWDRFASPTRKRQPSSLAPFQAPHTI